MIETIEEWLHLHRDYALVAVPAIAFAEAITGVGLLVSGAVLLTVCTVLYVEQVATLVQMLPLAFLGALAADHTGFYLGRYIGPHFHNTRFAEKHQSTIDRAESMFRRFGESAVIVGRLVTPIRSLVPLLAGVSGMDRVRYSMFDLLACAIWTTGLGLLVVGIDQLF